LWQGQNKRTGEVGEFPEIVFSLQPLRPAATADDTALISRGLEQTSQLNSTKNDPGRNGWDQPLIDLSVLPSSGDGITANSDPSAKSAPFANWMTFESTTDLRESAPANPIQSAQDTAADFSRTTTQNCSDLFLLNSGRTKEMTKYSTENSDEDKKNPCMDRKAVDFDYDAQVDVSDSALLIPAVSQTSISEPCSPAHVPGGVDNPNLLVSGDTACCMDEGDGHGLCCSLPVSKMSERLSWMTSASCENLDSGVMPAAHSSSRLCSRTQSAEHLFKASSDSPVYVASGGGSAPPVPPRDYPSRCRPPVDSYVQKSRATQQHTEIHPIVQDGQRRSSTHYWLLPEKQRFDTLPAPSDAESISYVNVPDSRSGHQKATRKASKLKQSAAEISHSQMDDMMRKLDISATDQPLESMAEIRDKVDLIRLEVGFDAVTFEESLSALSLNFWSVEEAIRYIKIEHLFRLGIASRDVCREALVAFQWDLLKAASCLVDRSIDHHLH